MYSASADIASILDGALSLEACLHETVPGFSVQPDGSAKLLARVIGVDRCGAAIRPSSLHNTSPGGRPLSRRVPGSKSGQRSQSKTRADLAATPGYTQAADRILYDAKTPPGAVIPGGMGVRFDWSLLQGVRPPSLGAVGRARSVQCGGGGRDNRRIMVDVSSGVNRRRASRIRARSPRFSTPQKPLTLRNSTRPGEVLKRTRHEPPKTPSAPSPTIAGISARSAAATSPRR